MRTSIDGEFIQQHLNLTLENLRRIYLNTVNALGWSIQDANSYCEETAEFDTHKWGTKGQTYCFYLLGALNNKFATCNYQVSDETLEWGGFMSHDTFLTFDEKAWKQVLTSVLTK